MLKNAISRLAASFVPSEPPGKKDELCFKSAGATPYIRMPAWSIAMPQRTARGSGLQDLGQIANAEASSSSTTETTVTPAAPDDISHCRLECPICGTRKR